MSFFQEIAKFNSLFGNEQGEVMKPNWEVAEHQLHLIQEEYSELINAVMTHNMTEARDAVADILVTVYGFAHRMGFNADQDLSEVNRSNFSKFCKNLEEAKATVVKYEKEGIETELVGIPTGYYAVKSAKDQTVNDKFFPKGKLLKSIYFSEPEFV